jgi:transposase
VERNDEAIEHWVKQREPDHRTLVLISGGLPSHRSRCMSDWIGGQRQWLHVEPLHGYAPDLNPIEQV